MEQEAGFIRQQNNQILNRFNMLLEIERTGRGCLDLCGFPESIQVLEPMGCHILS